MRTCCAKIEVAAQKLVLALSFNKKIANNCSPFNFRQKTIFAY